MFFYLGAVGNKSDPLHALVTISSWLVLVTVLDEFAPCIGVWFEGGASTLDAMLLDFISDFHELVH